jgi:A/G-specific adenine glycosylase
MIENKIKLDAFKKTVWDYYRSHFRSMPWRSDTNPYYVMVSELMLQQTQVQRVLVKFDEFIQRFPTIDDLAKATLSEVLETWIGLGYNRRAKFLKQSADIIVNDLQGQFPKTLVDWIKLPGFGKNTASAVLVYSQNEPLLFIETNIRTVFIHHFFGDELSVHDTDIEALVRATVDTENPREWYWALMDYGTFLKKEHGNLSRKSSSYATQSKFEGSFRQKRAKVLKEIVNRKVVSFDELLQFTNYSSEILTTAIEKLVEEKFIAGERGQYWVM